MNEDSWKIKLKNVQEDFLLLEKCKREALDNFRQFYEFIAEPAFERLRRELRQYRIRSSYGLVKKRGMAFHMNFPRSGVDNFHYILVLPRNAVEMRLRLVLRGRKTPRSELETREEDFMPRLSAGQVMRLEKEALLLDIIENYRDFNYRARTSEV